MALRKLRKKRSARRGSLTVEMVLVVIVLAIVTVGIVQFGVFFSNAQVVALAARVGALEASQTPDLPTADGGGVPSNIVSAIEHQLASSGIAWRHIRLEHNAPYAGDAVVLAASDSVPECPSKQPLAAPPYRDTQYVRLTVCVPLGEVFPQQLTYFGRQLFGAERTYEHSATFRYELTSP